ncbi:hypothetical protein [Streptomyces sp. NPDC007083]|uniref:hypothetical protein n=1 Tax=Streptomyces sp. NPDC007083 TaxID=3156913 RepID=UPI0033F1B621
MTHLTDELRATAQRLLDLADETAEDITTNDYWHSQHAPRERWFENGIDNAVGGPAGKLAGLFSPEASRALAQWLRFEADLIVRLPDAEMRQRTCHTLAVARAINQEQP